MKKSSTLRFLDVLSSKLTCCLLSKTVISKLNFLRFDVRTILPFIFMAMTFMFNTVNAQVNKTGNVPVVFPSGGFGVDGDAYAGHPILTVGDWWISETQGSTGGSVFDKDGNVVTPLPSKTEVTYFKDPYKGDVEADATIFSLSDKINDSPSHYTVKTGTVPPKDDMQRAAAVFTWGKPGLIFTNDGVTITGDPTDLWCLFAADRWEVNGSSYIDFEFNQNAIIFDKSLGTFTTEAPLTDFEGDPSGGRTPGDILFTIEFLKGGGIGSIWVDKWDKDGKGQAYYWKTQDLAQYAETIFITHNDGIEKAPWPIYDQLPDALGNYYYAPNQYAEGAINLSEVFGGTAKCGHLATVWVRTKSSHSEAAELKDLCGIASLNVGAVPPVANCSTITVPACATDLNTKFADWKAGFYKSEGTGTDPVEVTFNPALPDNLPANAECGYTFTTTYTLTDACDKISSCTGTFTITAPNKVTVSGPESIDKAVCEYVDQTRLTAAYNAWIEAFKMTEAGCNGKGDFEIAPPASVDFCKGIDLTVTYSAKDACTNASVTGTFKVTPAAQVAVSGPESIDKAVCEYVDQTRLTAAYNAWIEAFKMTEAGCNGKGGFDKEYPATVDFCKGIDLTLTYSANDACTNVSVTRTFKVTPPAPLVISNVKDVLIPGCTYGTQKDLDDAFALWLEGFNFRGGCKPEGVFVSTYTAPDRAIGGFIDVVYNVTDLCENGIDFARYTIQPCTNAHCTYTQGYYGNLGGMSCADGKQYTTKELIAKGLASYEGGKMTIGLPEHSVWIENTPNFIDAVIAVLPGGGGSYVLSGNKPLYPTSDLPTSYLKRGTLNNTLLAQTITLGLNLGIDGTLGGFALQEGTFYTAATESCGSNIPKLRECLYDPNGIYTGVKNEYKDCSIDPKVIAALDVKTVQGLFALANQALGGGSTNGLTLSEIAIAVDKINNAFDGCRLFVGYNVPPMDCEPTIDVSSSSLEKTTTATSTIFEAYPVPFNDLLTIRYKFNYSSEVRIEVFNSLGILMLTQTDANGYLDKEISLYINSQQEQVYVIKVTTNQENSVMKVLSSR